MNKIVIPVILVVTISIAGIFAFMPIDKAATVHTTITSDLAAKVVELGAITTGNLGASDVFTINCSAASEIVGLNFDFDAGGSFAGDTLAVAVGGDDLHTGLSLAVGGIDALHGSAIASTSGDDVTITITLSTDDGDESIGNARASIITSGSCTFVDTA